MTSRHARPTFVDIGGAQLSFQEQAMCKSAQPLKGMSQMSRHDEENLGMQGAGTPSNGRPTVDLTDKICLVTGGTRGIGLAVAELFLQAGARVAITGRNPERAAAARSNLTSYRPGSEDDVLAIAAHAGDPDDRARSVAAVMEQFGALDVLVNNAGVNPHVGPLVDCPLSALEKNLSLNTVSPIAYTQLAWQAWMRDHGGVVINNASIAGLVTTAGLGAYAASKAALIHATRELAWQLAPQVRVCAVAPGAITTPFGGVLFEGRSEQAASLYPMKRLGQPIDVAHAVLFLASPMASYLTGVVLPVDGGVTIRGYPDPVMIELGIPDRIPVDRELAVVTTALQN